MNKRSEHSDVNIDSIKADLTDSGHNIKKFSSELIEELSQYFEGKKGDIVGMKCKCKNHIKENPFIAVAGALAIGTLIGMICKK